MSSLKSSDPESGPYGDIGIRDAAITTSTLVDLYADDPYSYLAAKLVPLLESYANLSQVLQHTENPSGHFHDLAGLGEPKFRVNGTPFEGSWGRPQRDGPALRALTLMKYVRVYNDSHPEVWSDSEGQNPFADLYDSTMPADSVIKADLEYVSHHWHESGFDLWEEVNGLHFFTSIVQLRALREGADLATSFGDFGAATWYRAQTDQLSSNLNKFWNGDKGHLVGTFGSSRSGLDCGILLGAIHGTSDVDFNARYGPYSDEVLVSLLQLIRDQRHRFPINAVPDGNDALELVGIGIGRYPEDEYDGYGVTLSGGNPWFLCTSSASEVLYRTAHKIASTATLNITLIGLPFWRALLPNVDLIACGDSYSLYTNHDKIFMSALTKLKLLGDEFLAVVRGHADGYGALSEQFDRVTGYERGAGDLTWSYVAFLQAQRARKALRTT